MRELTRQQFVRVGAAGGALATLGGIAPAAARAANANAPINSFAGDYDSSTNYQAGQIVRTGSGQFLALQASVGQDPVSNPNSWTPILPRGVVTSKEHYDLDAYSNMAIGSNFKDLDPQGGNGGIANTAMGGDGIGHSAALSSITTGQANTAFGSRAGQWITTGEDNTAIGENAMILCTTGSYNTAVGQAALQNGTGSKNTAVGVDAMFNSQNCHDNTALGFFTGRNNSTGYGNTWVGMDAGYANTTGFYNVAVGIQALFRTTTGMDNTAVGDQAGWTNVDANANITGSRNTFIGANAGPGSPTQLNNATAIGNAATVKQSDSLVLGSIAGVNGAKASTRVGIGTAAPVDTLDVVGAARLSGGFGVWAKTPPSQQPPRAVTLQDVIDVLAGAGLTA